MKFYLDTGNVEEIKRMVKLGLVDGVTTNPSISVISSKLL